MLDFLILYEHRNRELENACLLAMELERRGYRTRIMNIYDGSYYWKNPSVVIVPHLYNNDQLVSFCDNYKHNNNKIISLQYEHILCEKQHEGIFNPKGEAVHAQHVAWGKDWENRYLLHSIKKENIHKIGFIGIDFCRKEFDGFYMSKSELAIKKGLDPKKKWVLFISSFSEKNMTSEEIQATERIENGFTDRVNESIESQVRILDWLERIALDNKDIVVIYRRHPAEREDLAILHMEKQISNFKSIEEYSVRQWVRCCDYIFTWKSTAISDAYFCNKQCYILRPIKVSDTYEYDFMKDAKFVEEYEEFKGIIERKEESRSFPIHDKTMEFYFGKDRMSDKDWIYQLWANMCENVLKNDYCSYSYDYRTLRKIHGISFGKKIKCVFYRVAFKVCTIINFNIRKGDNKNKYVNTLNKYSRESYRYKRCIKNYKAGFRRILINK